MMYLGVGGWGGVLRFMFISVTHDVYWGGGGVLAFMFSSLHVQGGVGESTATLKLSSLALLWNLLLR